MLQFCHSALVGGYYGTHRIAWKWRINSYHGFVVGSHKVKVDEEKVKAIQECSTHKIVSEVGSFHRLASFYKRFVKDFSTIISPLNEIFKKSVGFKLEESQERAFQALKDMLTQAPILACSTFECTLHVWMLDLDDGLNLTYETSLRLTLA
ncbi:Retrovirus-related Pol polyprotein from transposon gypsy, partial [Mucuna pruriens]